jgi:two-component system CheB/CheR fusion protein
VKAFHGFTCTGAPIHDAKGQVIGAIDVSTNANDGSPERLVAVAHAAFAIDRELTQRAALQTAEAATAGRDRLLAEVSHEVRTPLTAIVGWAQLVRANESMLPDGLAEIESSAWRLSVLVADLLEMSRIATGRMTLERTDLDFGSVLTSVASAMQSIATRRGVTMQVTTSGSTAISGDRRRLEQVVTNLLSNAVKFTPSGGCVTASIDAVDGNARLVVRDTGCGIEPQLLPFVFEYLRQGEQRGGLGLGLAIVREIVLLHGGTVTAASEGSGKGAMITVEIPLQPRS